MWDFPDDPHIQNLVLALDARGKVVAAVCHGPAALVNVRPDNGEFMVAREEGRINHNLIAMPAIVAAMRWDLVKAFELVRIVAATRRARDTA
jgi:putative intracellular protease/amidase